MKELSFSQVEQVSGGDRGDAAVAGMLVMGTGGWHAVKGASWGARLGAAAGPVGAIAGGALGAVTGAVVYTIFK